MNTISLNYIPQVPSNDPITWEVYPELPEGMSLVNGVISGTPTVYAANQTYTIFANQSGDTTTLDMYFSVDTNNPHTVVENSQSIQLDSKTRSKTELQLGQYLLICQQTW